MLAALSDPSDVLSAVDLFPRLTSGSPEDSSMARPRETRPSIPPGAKRDQEQRHDDLRCFEQGSLRYAAFLTMLVDALSGLRRP